MHIISTRTVTLDAVEVREIILEYLRAKEILPEDQKCNVILSDINEVTFTGTKGLDIAQAGACRIKVWWTPND